MAGVAQRFDLRAAGAVEVVEHLRVFEEFALVPQALELIDADEVVVASPALRVGRCLRVVCETDTRSEGSRSSDRLHQAGLAGPGGCRDDEQRRRAAWSPTLIRLF